MSKRFLQKKLRRGDNRSRRQQAQGPSVGNRSIGSASSGAALAPKDAAAFSSSYQVVSHTPATSSTMTRQQSRSISKSSLVSSPTYSGGSIPGDASAKEQNEEDCESDSSVKYRILGLESSCKSQGGSSSRNHGDGGMCASMASSSSWSTADRMPSESWNNDCASSVASGASNASRSSHKSLFSFSSKGSRKIDDETRTVIESQSKRIAALTSEKRSLVSSCMSLHSQLHDVERQFAKVESDLMDKIVSLESDLQGTHGNAQSAILATEREMTARLQAIRALSEASRHLQRKVHAQGAVLMMKEQELDRLKSKCHKLERKSKSDLRRKASMQKALLACMEKSNQLELELNLKSILLDDARSSMNEEKGRHMRELTEANEEIARLKEVVREKDNTIESLRGENTEEEGDGEGEDGGERGGGGNVSGQNVAAAKGKDNNSDVRKSTGVTDVHESNVAYNLITFKDDMVERQDAKVHRSEKSNHPESSVHSSLTSSTFVEYPRAAAVAGVGVGVDPPGAVWG